MSSILLGVALTFAGTDGRELLLTVSLTHPATAAVSWGDLARTATVPALLHRFGPFPAPSTAPVAYTLDVAGERREVEVPALSTGRLRIAVYGDSRSGHGPHRVLVDRIESAKPDVFVHTGDVVETTADELGFRAHMSATLELGCRSPLILALGNHEVLAMAPNNPRPLDGMKRMLRHIPPAKDPLVARHQVSPAAFRVRVGPALFISLDSNTPLDAASAQRRFLEDALADKGGARFVFVTMHHGPLSSGPHGPNPGLLDVGPLLERHGVTAVLAGHDHLYERIVQNGVTYLVSGGGGAPLYFRARDIPGSAAFVATYNYAIITIDGERADLEAYSLEGTLLDRAVLAPAPASASPGSSSPDPMKLAAIAAALIAIGAALAVTLLRMFRAG